MTHTITPAPSGFYVVSLFVTGLGDSSDILVEFNVRPAVSVGKHLGKTMTLNALFQDRLDIFDVIDMNSGLVFTEKCGAIPLWEYKDCAIHTNQEVKSLLGDNDEGDEIFTSSKAYDQLVSTFPDFEKKQAQYLNIKMKIKE